MTNPTTSQEALSRLTRWMDGEVYPGNIWDFNADVSVLISAVRSLKAIIGPKAHCQACGSIVEMTGERAGECHCTVERTGTQRLQVHDAPAYEEIAALSQQVAELTEALSTVSSQTRWSAFNSTPEGAETARQIIAEMQRISTAALSSINGDQP